MLSGLDPWAASLRSPTGDRAAVRIPAHRHQRRLHERRTRNRECGPAVLIIAPDSNSPCVGLCSSMSFVPLLRCRLHLAIVTLRRQRPAAVWIDATRPEIDALECILNIRDMDRITPVFVLGGRAYREGAQRAMRQARVYQVHSLAVLREAAEANCVL